MILDQIVASVKSKHPFPFDLALHTLDIFVYVFFHIFLIGKL